MHQVQISNAIYKKVQRKATEAGYADVDAFVTRVLEQDLNKDVDDFDDRFTPELDDYLDGVVAKMKAGDTFTLAEAESSLEEFRAEWLKNRAG